MKRTWVVYVGMNAGHELTNSITDAEWYGPFTRQQALTLESDLNKLLDDGETEHEEATALPLEFISPREVLRRQLAIQKGGTK